MNEVLDRKDSWRPNGLVYVLRQLFLEEETSAPRRENDAHSIQIIRMILQDFFGELFNESGHVISVNYRWQN